MKRMIVMSLVLSGCVGQPVATNVMSPEQLQGETDTQLIKALAWSKDFDMGQPDPEVMAEIERRELLTDRELSAVRSRTVFEGMSTYALVASQGIPSDTTTFSDGTSFLFFHGYPELVVTVRESKVVCWVRSSY